MPYRYPPESCRYVLDLLPAGRSVASGLTVGKPAELGAERHQLTKLESELTTTP
jgi:hypothetical protein